MNALEEQIKNYHQWVAQSNLPPMTSTQAEFAKWLLHPDQVARISKIGNLEIIFKSIYWFCKDRRK